MSCDHAHHVTAQDLFVIEQLMTNRRKDTTPVKDAITQAARAFKALPASERAHFQAAARRANTKLHAASDHGSVSRSKRPLTEYQCFVRDHTRGGAMTFKEAAAKWRALK